MKRYNFETFFLLELESTEAWAGSGTMTTFWNWEITVVSTGEDYKAKAVESKKGAHIGWVDIQGMNFADEMIKICQNYMEKQ